MQVMFLFKYNEKTRFGVFSLLIFRNVPQQTNCTKRYISSFHQSLNHHIARRKIVSKSCRFAFMVLLIFLVRVVFVKSNKTTRSLGIFSHFAVEVFGVQYLPSGLELGSKMSAWHRFWLFCQKWMSPISPKIAVCFMCLTVSPKLLYQNVRALSRFVDRKLSLHAVFSWFLKLA